MALNPASCVARRALSVARCSRLGWPTTPVRARSELTTSLKRAPKSILQSWPGSRGRSVASGWPCIVRSPDAKTRNSGAPPFCISFRNTVVEKSRSEAPARSSAAVSSAAARGALAPASRLFFQQLARGQRQPARVDADGASGQAPFAQDLRQDRRRVVHELDVV